jgi:hypothetical protein
MSAEPLEYEITLVVLDQPADRVAVAVEGLDAIAGFVLVPGPVLAMVDRYFDTEDAALSVRGMGLRVRHVGASAVLTLKGPSRKGTHAGAVERREIEGPWGREILTRIVGTLEREGVSLPLCENPPYDDPVQALQGCGLKIVQHREGSRTVRKVATTTDGTELAELVVDRVIYRFSGAVVRHTEIEIECTHPDGMEAAHRVSEGLLDRYSEDLAPWNHGKLATGSAVEILLRSGNLQGRLTRDGHLMRGAYPFIDGILSAIKKGRAGAGVLVSRKGD